MQVAADLAAAEVAKLAAHSAISCYPNKFTSDCPAYKMDQEKAYHLWHDDIVAVIEGFHPSIRITQMLAKLQDAR